MTELTTFNFGNVQIRTHLDADRNVWFACKDVAIALEYSEASLGQLNNLFGAVPTEWKGHKPIMTLGGVQDLLCVSEQGLYFFVCRSDKPKALPFQKWVAGDVLPSIRKTGAYNAPAVVKSAPAIALTDKLNAAKIILGTAGIEGNQLTLALDKVYHHETNESLLQVTGTNLVAPEQSRLLNPTEVGQLFGMTAIKLNKLFAKFGLQVKLPSGKWELTELGRANGGVLLDVNKPIGGAPVQQIKWDARILNFLKKVVDKVE